MNLIADAMEPYLRANTIRFTRNTPDMTAASSIAQAARGSYDFYLALHSNASGDGSTEGRQRGIIAFYYPASTNGRRAAGIFAENLKRIYPLPNLVTTRATTTLGEVRQPKPPAVLLEIGYHDNYADATWVEGHMDAIAQQLARALTRFFGLPFIYPMEPETGTVSVSYGTLNLRSYPSSTGTIIANMPNGASVRIYGEWQGWYVVHYQGYVGYAAAAFIDT